MSKMTVDHFRQLLALRYTAESVEEVNTFLARALETQVRLLKQSAKDRIAGYFAGVAAAVLAAFTISDELVAPALVLAVYFLLMAGSAVFHLWKIHEQDKELTVDHNSVREYLKKATRDRLENRVSMAIQNRKAAARLLNRKPEELDPDDKKLLVDNVQFWGERIKESEGMLNEQAKGDIWAEHQEMMTRIQKWIETELGARPPIT